MSGCRCCAPRRNDRRDFRQGGVSVDDFEKEVRYRKPNSGGWSKRKRVCKKSKTGEKCDFSVVLIAREMFSRWDETWHYTKVMTCSRCGKHGPYAFITTKWRLP